MSDYNSSLPVRTETNGDVVAQLCDATVTSQKLAIDAAGKLAAKLSDGAGNAVTSQVNGSQQALDVGVNVAGVQIDPRQVRALTAADVVTANQGTKGLITNAWPVQPTDGTNSASYTAAGEAKVSVTQPLPAGTNAIGKVDIRDGSGNALTSSAAGGTRPLDVAMRDSSGNLYTSTNPFPVAVSSDNAGDEINNYNTVANVASNATSNHDYTVTALKTLLLTQIEASAAVKMKIEVQIETAAGSGIFNTKFVQFSSTAETNMSIVLKSPISVVAGAKVRIIRTNLDKSQSDVYSTICGQEV